MGTALRKKRLEPKDLSAQLGVYYKGTCPGGTVESLWAYEYKEESKKRGAQYFFSDCYQSFEKEPLLVPFSIAQVSELLERV